MFVRVWHVAGQGIDTRLLPMTAWSNARAVWNRMVAQSHARFMAAFRI
jgi:hypothetical protein